MDLCEVFVCVVLFSTPIREGKRERDEIALIFFCTPG